MYSSKLISSYYPWHDDPFNILEDVFKLLRFFGSRIWDEGPQIAWLHIRIHLPFFYVLEVVCNIIHHLFSSFSELCGIHIQISDRPKRKTRFWRERKTHLKTGLFSSQTKPEEHQQNKDCTAPQNVNIWSLIYNSYAVDCHIDSEDRVYMVFIVMETTTRAIVSHCYYRSWREKLPHSK